MDNKPYFVSPYPSRPNTPWKLELRAAYFGRKIRRFCGTEGEAWALGAELTAKLRTGGTKALEKKTGLSMRGACQEFRAKYATKSKSHRDKVNQIADLLEAKFPLADVAPSDLSRWFDKLEGSETTRAMFYRYIRLFFRWARKMRYIPEDPSEVLDAPKAAVGRNILTPRQMTSLLELDMPGWLRATMLLGGFAGLRTAEMLRMDWDDIDLETGEIEIRPGVGKDTGGFLERIVDFTDPLTRRKDQLTGKGKLVPIPKDEFHAMRRGIVAGLGWPAWPDNCLRHSFATYHLAVSKNAGVTAFQMGHTNPSMVQRVYAVPARKANGAAWWAI
jgi:integrase